MFETSKCEQNHILKLQHDFTSVMLLTKAQNIKTNMKYMNKLLHILVSVLFHVCALLLFLFDRFSLSIFV